MTKKSELVLLLIGTLFLPQINAAQSCNGKDFTNSKATNGSFEQPKTSCTTDVGFTSSTKGALAWERVTQLGGSVYLNNCSPLGSFNPNDNTWGSQSPLTGNATIRIRSGPCFGICIVEDPNTEYSYLRQELATPLQKGITYYIEFFVSLTDVSRYGVNSLGMFLTNNPNDLILQLGQTNLTHLTPQIPNVFPSSTAYLDINGWTKICGFYTPSVDGVKHIIIGNFRGISNYATSTSAGYKGKLESIPYYYIDDVYISEYSCCPEERFFQNTSSLPTKTSVNGKIVAGNSVLPQTVGDVVVTAGQNVTFKAGNNVNLKPGFKSLSGSTFSAKIGGCEKGVDDNQLKVVIQTVSLGSQITLTANVTNGSGSYTYNWSNGATTPSITVTYGFNAYTVVVTDVNQDSNYPTPCNTKVGWAQYVDNCPICRASTQAASAKSEEDTEKEKNSQKESESSISIFPNPSTGIFTIRTYEAMKSVVVSNLIGSAVRAISLGQQAKEAQIDLSDCPKGTYIIRILTETGTFINKQVIVK